MPISLSRLAVAAAFGLLAGLLTPAGAARAAISGEVVRIGVLTDLGGPFSDWSGAGSVEAARMAAEDFAGAHPGLPYRIEIVAGDFQLKPDLASAIARQWIDRGINAIIDLPQSGAALAVNSLLRGSKVALLVTGAQHDDLTTRECSANSVQWTFDSSALTRSTVTALAQEGRGSWFFLTAEIAAGKSMQAAARAAIDASGGRTLGAVQTPVNTADFSSFLLQAASSGAQTIGVIQAGADLVQALKQAAEFGIAQNGQKLAVTFAQLSDIKALGLPLAQGLVFTEAFYWDVDDGKRAFARRFAARQGGRYPTAVQAGAYSAILHYLKAVAAEGSTDGPAVIAGMKALPVDDALFGPGRVRADGRMVHDMYLVAVKAPAASTGPWDLYQLLRTVPGDAAFRPMSRDCPLVAGP